MLAARALEGAFAVIRLVGRLNGDDPHRPTAFRASRPINGRLGSVVNIGLEHLPKRLNRGVPLRERMGFKARTGMEASMDGETDLAGSAFARGWCVARWRYHPGNCGATWSEYQLCRALP